MKRIFLLLLMMPVLAMAQTKPKPKPKAKVTPTIVIKQGLVQGKLPKTKSVAVKKTAPLPTRDNFIINGTMKGYPDGTPVSLLNGQTGAAESETTIQKGKFVLTGKLPIPDFKLLTFNRQPPYITMLLDNSVVKLSGKKDSLDKVAMTGSQSNADFILFNDLLEPYKQVFDENAPYDSAALVQAMLLTSLYAEQRPHSYVSPLAIIRYHQIAEDPAKTEMLFNTLDSTIRVSPMGGYISKLLEEAKKNAIGSVLPDFSQADTAGVNVSLSSFRGKYVLIDFWASWCRPCRMENPNVVAAFNKYKDKNFTVLGVSLDKTKQAWVDAIAQDNLAWTQLSDLQGWGNAAALKYEIFSIPQNFLIDPNGKIVGKNLRGVILEREIATLDKII